MMREKRMRFKIELKVAVANYQDVTHARVTDQPHDDHQCKELHQLGYIMKRLIPPLHTLTGDATHGCR